MVSGRQYSVLEVDIEVLRVLTGRDQLLQRYRTSWIEKLLAGQNRTCSKCEAAELGDKLAGLDPPENLGTNRLVDAEQAYLEGTGGLLGRAAVR